MNNKDFAHQTLSKLVNICVAELNNTDIIYDYLVARKINNNTIKKFNLGAFPKDLRVIINKLNTEKELELLKQFGIIYNAESSSYKTLFPLIIPIQDVYGRYIGIGGRCLLPEDERQARGIIKYKNSIYDKKLNLFGLNFAKEAIREKNKAILVEGYFDVISAHQAGINNAVASSGTLFSIEQVNLLARYTENIGLLFDNDEPGRNATAKLLPKRQKEGINIIEQTLPKQYKDLDEYCKDENKMPIM